MTRLINTTLIGLVAFFVFLAVLWLFIDPAAPGLANTEGGGPSPVEVRSTSADWADGSDGTAVDVEVLLRNTGAAGTVTQVAYRATLDGQVVAANTDDPPVVLPAGMDVPVRFTVDLPPDFASRWFQVYQQNGESATLRIDGTLATRTAAVDQRLPFEWKSSWSGKLLSRLSESTPECPGPPAPLCMSSIDAGFAQGRLATTLELRNDNDEPLLVRNGTFTLAFEDVVVATGRVDETFEIAEGGEEAIEVTLAFDDGALADWWGGHVGRCESSSLSLSIGLEVQRVGRDPSLVDWDILAAPFDTGFLCKERA